MTQLSESLFRLVPLFGMVAIVALNLLAANRRTARQTGLEAARLVVALRTELATLLELYRDNLDLLARNATYLLSAKSCAIIYRGNISRLVLLLEEHVLGPLVAAFAFNERLEAHLAACTKRGGGIAYSIDPDVTPLDEIKLKYEQGCEAIELALRALGGGTGEASAAPARIPVVSPARLARQLVRRFKALVERESARRLARLGGSEPALVEVPRR